MKKKKHNKGSAVKRSISSKLNKKSHSALADFRNAEDFPIIGIGASAGGLEAIEGFFAGIPKGQTMNMAFVIIQHLSPEHKSMMGSLLEKYTDMKILEIKDGIKVEPGCVYLNPPNKDAVLMNDVLQLLQPIVARGIRLPIDVFFRSLAQCRGDKSICMILSGTGTDGTLGLKAIKEAGGMAMVQEEAQARYDGMPRSAIDTGLVDHTLPVGKMAAELLQYVKHPYIGASSKEIPQEGDFENQLQKIFILIRSATGHDFSHYKRNTTVRRIQRRMAVHQTEEISSYVRFLQENAAEVKTLFKDLLIAVTNFFRDSHAFKALNEKVILPLIAGKQVGASVRVWVVGCSTGEEVYSIAMLFLEAVQSEKKNLNVQIFATDIDEQAIAYARAGTYPEGIEAEVTAERLKSFFVKKDRSYSIRKQIREMVVFANQDVIKDSPFSKLDLICCRNVLIYMDNTLQKKLLPLFHYTLNPGGFLFLGTSETVGDSADRFLTVDTKYKIFKRTGASAPLLQMITPSVSAAGPLPPSRFEPAATNIRQIAERTLLQNYTSPCVLIDENFNVRYFHGETGLYLNIPEGEPDFNILKMAPEDLRQSLGELLKKSVGQKGTVVAKAVKIMRNQGILTVNLVMKPLLPSGKEKLMMVMFEDVSETASSRATKKESVRGKDAIRFEALEQELLTTKEYLRSTIEELETSNEELKSANEELQSTSEEMQSANEELETSREELQSTNEELTTVNSELQNKVDEWADVNNDLNNILVSARAGAILLDHQLNIKRFTPSVKQYFKLIGSDMGRPISDVVHNLKYEGLLEDLQNVLQNHQSVEKETESKNGAWVLIRIMPNLSGEGELDGVVVTFFDNTATLSAKSSKVFIEGILGTIREPLVVMDEALRVLSASKAFYEKFGVKTEETEGNLIYELGNGQWDIPALRKLLEEILPKKLSFDGFRVEHNFQGLGPKVMLLSARQIFHGGIARKAVLLAIEDVTGK